MVYKKIPLAGPSITQKEIEYVNDAIRNGWYETYDMHIRKLEKMFADYVGARYAIATYCGTHALHLAALALGLKEGDEVIVPDQSYIATAHAISYVGATSVFVDIDQRNLCINAGLIEKAITEKTKAIMVVHFAGAAVDMDPILAVAKKYHLAIIEDACQAVGVQYKDKYVGSIGDIGTYSFQGTKIAVGGEGGMFVTNDKKLYERAFHFGTFCRNDEVKFLWSDDIGYNYRISNITAAVILAQMERIDELIAMKKRIFHWYYDRLKDSKFFTMKTPEEYCKSNYSYVVGMLSDEVRMERDLLLRKLMDENIHARPGYPSMSLMPGYERRFPVPDSEKYERRGVVLPTAMSLAEEDVERVCCRLNDIISENR